MAQTMPKDEAATTPEAEAPEAIFENKIGDVGVVLEAQGSWTTRLAGGWGLGISNQGTLTSLGYPGYEKGVVFSQHPDFSLTLRLLERFYLQLIYSGSIEDRSFLVGYTGRPGEFLQWAKGGNASFTVPPRAGQTLAEGQKGAPAAAAAGVAGPVTWEVLGRYEDGNRETKTFRGFQETQSSLVGLDQWIRHRFFRIPASAAPLTSIRVLVADPSGSLGSKGDRYREADSSEAIIQTTGEIRLSAPATRRFLVTWDGAAGWANPASPLLGWKATPITDPTGGSGSWYVLVQPGTPSSFDERNRYPISTGNTGAIVLVDRDQGTPVPDYSVGQAATQDWFEVSGEAEAPFYATVPGLYPATSDTTRGPPPSPSTLPWAFQVTPSSKATSFSLGTDVLPSSVIVIRNGVPITAFRFDESSGALQLDVPVYETDRVEISFQRKASGSKASDLVLWQGGRWDLEPNQSLEWAVQGRWNMENGRYTTADLQSPGRMALSLTYAGTAGDWSWKLSATGGALLTDSTGHRRLYGLASAGTSATLDGNALRPSAAPGVLGGLSLNETNRAAVVFRNYWTSDPLTGTPEVGIWGKSGVLPSPSVTDGWIGPYLVRGDGTRTDRLAVLESTSEPGTWAGMQVYLDQGKAMNLGSTSAISLTLRVPEGTNGARLFFQTGSLSENWDGTGSIRELEYRSYPSLSFFDQNRGQRYFPIPEGSDWGNDADEDGTAGADGTLVARELSTDLDYTTWQTVRIVLTDAERQLLERTTGWRMVLAQTVGTGTRTVLVGPVVFEGSRWSVREEPTATLGSSVTPVEEVDPEDSSRQQLRVDWSNRLRWTIEGRNSGVRPAAYRTISFRYKLLNTDDATNLVLSLTNADGVGVKAAWTPKASSRWVTGRINLKDRTLSLDGEASTGTVNLTSGAKAWDRLSITKGGASTTGELVVAEIEAVDPVWEPLGTTVATATWKQPQPWPSADLPLVSGVAWDSTSIQSGMTADDLSWKGQTTVSGAVGPLRLSGEASYLRTAQEQENHGAYQATLPLGWSDGPRIEWTDRFSDEGLRVEKVTLGLPWVGTWEAQVSAKGPPVSLDQEYSLGWKAPEAIPGWATSINGLWTQSTAQAIALTGFGKLWVDSWSWLPPVATTAPFYYLQGTAKTQGTWAPFSWDLKVQNQVSQSTGTLSKWNAWGDWTLKVPYRASGQVPWVLTPSLSKSVSTVSSRSSVLSPRESVEQALGGLWMSPGGLGTVPFGEDREPSLWSDTGFQSGLSLSAAGLDWERPSTSDWTDLVVPNTMGTKITVGRGRETLADYRYTTVSGQVQNRAINLFGALGSLPLLSWYRTDVWTWSATGTWGTGTRDQDQATTIGGSVRSDIVFSAQESVSLPVTYQGTWGASPSQNWKVKPKWSLSLPVSLPVELPRWLSPSAFRRQLVQDLGVDLELGWTPKPAPLVRDLQVAWKGRFLLSEKSELDLTTKWGQQWQQNLTVVGLEAALDLILNF